MIPFADLRHGDCREIIATLDDNSIDAIATDPPYELGFMGKKWDNTGIAYDVQLWTECLRVLKHGGHLLAFGGTRTYHRMTCAIEDAGFEIRDSIHWLYGSGFPKSHDVSKSIDKTNGETDRLHKFTAWMRTTGLTARQINNITESNMGGHYLTAKSQPAIPTAALWAVIRPHCNNVPEWVDELVQRIAAEREVIGTNPNIERAARSLSGVIGFGAGSLNADITAPATDAAREWEGWGTALKPAHEPIVVARKPLIGTVAANVLQHGTGALNIDGARVGERWPANVIVDETVADTVEWSRYFYCPKASRTERNAGIETSNTHPTVKPLELMRYLVRLVTPPGGTVLEPFAGSGTTLAAAIIEGFNAIGCELIADYLPIIEGRIAWAQQQYVEAHDNLFGDNA